MMWYVRSFVRSLFRSLVVEREDREATASVGGMDARGSPPTLRETLTLDLLLGLTAGTRGSDGLRVTVTTCPDNVECNQSVGPTNDRSIIALEI